MKPQETIEPVLTEEEGKRLIAAINKVYGNKKEFVDELDDLMYALFFLDTKSIEREKQQGFAFVIKKIRESL